jgi:hypothetical protein
MAYVKTNPDGSAAVYPYSLTQLKRDNPNVSFPSPLTDDVAANFLVFPVKSTQAPAFDYRKNNVNGIGKISGEWTQIWTQVDASPEEITQRTENKAQAVRSERNAKLADCDWTQLADSPLDPDGKLAWALYRETLRMVPEQSGFPWEVNWPPAP